MVNANDRNDAKRIDDEELLDQRKSDATNDEPLSDIEESESDSSSTPQLDPGPSPDGLLDEPDEIKDAGPM
ncbi:MAG TPA: hypothetical protein VGO73_05785 [Pyrinomonadaceae bacterium]|jgi:hypothetical protein|nr:hypothetical protein [Pyrinomonadaceae bacterium]